MNPVLTALFQIGGLVVLTLGGWAVTKLSGWLGLKQDSEVRGYLLDIVGIATDAAKRRLELLLVDAPPDQVAALRAQVVGELAQYVANKAPDALSRLGVGDMAVREMIEVRLPPHLLAPAGS